NFPIAARSSLLGRTPASVFASAFTSIMNRISRPSLSFYRHVERGAGRSTREFAQRIDCRSARSAFDNRTGDQVMQYLLIVFDDPVELANMNDAERARIAPDYRVFTERIMKTGSFRA